MTTKTPEEWQREVDALKEPARLFGELMAVMHGDGGHYLAEHGAQKSYDDAVAKHHALRAERDSATAEVKLLREEMAVCVGERDEARAERDEARHYVDHKPNCRAMSPGISQREVDALRAENARLRDVCDAADVIRDSLYISPSMEIIYAAGSNEIEALRDALDAAEWVYFSTATVEADPSKRADMGALIRRLARRLDPADPLRIAATQYLSQHGLHGRPLRGGASHGRNVNPRRDNRRDQRAGVCRMPHRAWASRRVARSRLLRRSRAGPRYCRVLALRGAARRTMQL